MKIWCLDASQWLPTVPLMGQMQRANFPTCHIHVTNKVYSILLLCCCAPHSYNLVLLHHGGHLNLYGISYKICILAFKVNKCVLQSCFILLQTQHNTTFRDGTSPQLEKLNSDTLKCPFCVKAGQYHAMIAHLQGHQRSVIKCGGKPTR